MAVPTVVLVVVDDVLDEASEVFLRFDMGRHVLNVLLEFRGVEAADVTPATDILWTPDRMSRIGARLPG